MELEIWGWRHHRYAAPRTTHKTRERGGRREMKRWMKTYQREKRQREREQWAGIEREVSPDGSAGFPFDIRTADYFTEKYAATLVVDCN